MAKVNKIKFYEALKVINETETGYSDLMYDFETGDFWVKWALPGVRANWTEYDSNNILCTWTHDHTTGELDIAMLEDLCIAELEDAKSPNEYNADNAKDSAEYYGIDLDELNMTDYEYKKWAGKLLENKINDLKNANA